MIKQPGGRSSEDRVKPEQEAVRFGEQMDQDLIMILARTVLERLEEIEKESGLDSCPTLADEIRSDGLQLMKEIAGFKARLRWIAEGM